MRLNGKTLGLLVTAALLLPYCLHRETTHTYLVKLWNLPDFHGRVTGPTGQNHFDSLVERCHGQISDLYPEENDGGMGRWVVVTDKDDILQTLQNDTEDIANVEDGLITWKNPEDGLNANLVEDKPVVKDDKTWGLRIPKVREALKNLKPSADPIIVAVVDTGMDLNHPALKESLVPGHNFAGGDENDPSNRAPSEMHATHVAGTIAAKLDSSGHQGIAYGFCKIMPERVLGTNGSGTTIDVARGIGHAANHGAKVINMSLGSPSHSRALDDVCQDALRKGVTIVCAKGNSNTDQPNYPSDFEGVIKVAATSLFTDGTEGRAYFSNYGKITTCSAPGHFIWSCIPDGKYMFASGTSMACPHTAACAAVILSQNGDLTPAQVEKILRERGDEIPAEADKPIGLRINLQGFLNN